MATSYIIRQNHVIFAVGAAQEPGYIDVEELRITQRTYTGTRGSLCRPDRDFPTFVR